MRANERMRTLFGSGAIFMTLMGLLSPLTAAPAAEPPQPSAPPATVIDRNHHLGPGDIVEVTVQGFAEFSRTARLFADGTLDFPPLGAVPAAGLTTMELGAKITEGLTRELRRPVVSVRLQYVYVPPKPKVTVMGAATTKGEIDRPQPGSLRALLAQVNPTESADMAHIRVRYPDGSARTVDFSQFRLTGKSEDDLLLQGGEEVVLLERPGARKPDTVRITVLGEVAKPGTYEVADSATVLEILEKAGGAKPSADLERVAVQGAGGSSATLVNVERYLGGDTAAGYAGHGGDTLVVPPKPLRVLVFGEVGKPGELPIGRNERLLDVYLRAGISKDGDPSRALLIRRGKDGRAVSQPVDLYQVMKGKEQGNHVMTAGDVLFVPPKKEKRQKLLDYLNLISSPLWLLRSAVSGF
jgi:polysaccharide biosynthesis/export protein